ncbi:protein phosphatase inhibitor 2 isoform X4 [Iris pallida]|uniref:Protein phosphatase inhibitor 2 isoform X4 n=1 Tax=Iris pallida TaxID=29817 RepID=A0AAX6FNJ9_IRIPA|nr:protein phosphatase inhibitor 2 isoform X4 [Iris pallida]
MMNSGRSKSFCGRGPFQIWWVKIMELKKVEKKAVLLQQALFRNPSPTKTNISLQAMPLEDSWSDKRTEGLIRASCWFLCSLIIATK